MRTHELRESFLSFFESKGHRRDRSSPLIPHNDPTLLFANAGMNQFKDLFTGKESRSYLRATTCQKCVRAGGKHNDLEQVGFTRRHHTFFEMLGNFSFGDYFKADAIEFAWEYLTKTLGLSKKDLWISVFEKDDEAETLWMKIAGLSKDRIVRMGEKDNFWAMGETGPCGPCSEIYVDRGERYGKDETIFSGGERFLEIWNLVFMQYERLADGTMTPLPKPSVDTGMGLERLASVVQNVESNYLGDGMFRILKGFGEITRTPYGQSDDKDIALRVLTDHIRSVSFLMADGVQPSNEGRGYVLRRILRRAIRYGKKLGCERPFFHEGVHILESEMGAAYPELVQNSSAIRKMIHLEEEKFFETLDHGLKLLESKTTSMKVGDVLSGPVAFQLYDTFGFPVDLTEILLKEQGFGLDHRGFEQELEKQRERSRQSWKGSGEETVSEVYQALVKDGLTSHFVGYESLRESTRVSGVLVGGKNVQGAEEGQRAEIILEKTPFYPEGGGQVGDQGVIHGKGFRFHVMETKKHAGLIVHKGVVVEGRMHFGDGVDARVDEDLRLKTRINHTITHVLHATLQEVLGDHIKQAGSLVNAEYLRFDFTHPQALTQSEIDRIETTVNERIRSNASVSTAQQSLEAAIAGGAKAFFDEKYGDEVRVISVGAFSKELCGGTHAQMLGEAGLFKITAESGVSSGVRRIVAATGSRAYEFVRQEEEVLYQLEALLKSPAKDLVLRVEKLLKERAELQKRVSQPSVAVADEATVLSVGDWRGFVKVVTTEDAKSLRALSDLYKQKIKEGFVVLGAVVESKVTILIAVTDETAGRFQTQKLVQSLNSAFEGRGGGKPTFAQIGGTRVEELTQDRLEALVRDHLKSLL